MEQLYFKTRKGWREWLQQNHDENNGIWLVFYKKHTGKESLIYEEAVEEALCFGWIDSIIKKLDEEKYMQKFTPRKAKSIWSKLNKKRVAKLIEDALMTEIGLAKIEVAKTNGSWNKSPQSKLPLEIPKEFIEALDKNSSAKDYFNKLAPSYRKQFIGWIASAKRQDTKTRRIHEAISILERGEKLGMK